MHPHQDNYTQLTTGAIPSVITRMAVPTIISMLVTSLYNIADTFFVGQIDTQSTAAVGVVFSAMSIIHAVGFFFGHGSGNFISRTLGAKDRESAARMSATGFVYAIAAGLIITIVGEWLLTPLAIGLGSTPTILPYAEQYMAIILLGAPVMTGGLVLNNQMRFQGNASLAMVGIVSGAVLNVALDPLLILGFGWGIVGAAWATVISQTFSFLLLLYMQRRGDNIRLDLRRFTPSIKYVREIVAGGTPSLTRQSLGCVATILLNVVAGVYGDAAIAAMSIVSRITFVIFSVIIGLGQGFQPLCGFSFGAGLYERVRRAFWFCVRVGTIFLTLCAIFLFVFSTPVIAIFRDDPDVIRIGSEALRYQVLVYPLGALTMLSNMFLQTVRMPWRANILAAARRGLFFIPMILILPSCLALYGLVICQPVCDTLAFIVTLPVILYSLRTMEQHAKRKAANSDS